MTRRGNTLLKWAGTPALAMAFGLMVGTAHASTINLFSDTFNDTATTPANDLNGTTNTSVSGTFAQSDSANYSLISGNGTNNSTESGGLATISDTNTTTNGSAMLLSLWDYASDSNVASSGSLTVSVADFTTPTGSNWMALNIMTAAPTSPGATTYLLQTNTLLGILLRDSDGLLSVRSKGDTIGTASYSDADITVELTDITGLGTATGSFKYAVLNGVTQVDSGTVSGDLSGLYIGLESRTGASTVGDLEITTVPEPGSLALLGLGSLCVLRRRRA